MNSLHYLSKNEDGFVLITAMVMLVILTLLGTFALNTTIFELQIAGNDRVHKETFYKAESGDTLAVEVLEQNIYCADGFSKTASPASPTNYNVYTYDSDGVWDSNATKSLTPDVRDIGVVRTFGWLTEPSITNSDKKHTFKELAFYLNEKPWEGTICNVFMPDRPNISFPISSISADIDSDTERTDVYLGGSTRKLPGGSLQMAAGYERLGKSAAGGGTVRGYDIISRHRGVNNSESVVLLGWDHLIGMEFGDDAYCK